MKLILALVMARIIAGGGASATLQQWCAVHHLPPLVAHRALGWEKPPPAAVLTALGAPASEIAYRRVRLACGARTLSVADNWYVPAQLTPAMNAELAAGETPFGLVVRPLGFHRRTLDAHGRVVRAVLVDKAGHPFSYVVETYANALGD